MDNKQQEETLQYFKAYAEDWHKKAQGAIAAKVNVIQQRNGYVLEVIKERAATNWLLDVGCGTGDLVCDAARQGVNGLGVDFAQEMIDIAREKSRQAGLGNAYFECCSIFDCDFSTRKFDVAAANGFIEYISQDALLQFFDLMYQALTPGGSFVVGSRNRLFNLYSLNDFTRQELVNNHIHALLEEALAFASGDALEEILNLQPAPLQTPETQHADTGIHVSTRFQYTPLQLIRILSEKGFAIKEIYPVHVHGVPPAFKAEHPETHTAISNLLQNYARQHLSLLPFASTFMLHAEKPL